MSQPCGGLRGGVLAQGRTPSRFLSNYFSSQCSIYGEQSTSSGGLSQTENFSQDNMLCTPDFITPQDQQFGIGHGDGDVNKENRPMRSPCQLSPAGRKKPKKSIFAESDTELSQPVGSQGVIGSQDYRNSQPATSSQGDGPPAAPSRASILHYCRPPTSARKRSIMPPPQIRSPPVIPNPFLGEDEASGDQQRRRGFGQPPSSRYRAEFKEMGHLGAGSFCKVYKALSRMDGAQYAIKRTHREVVTAPEKSQALQEVQALAAAGSHTSLVRYFSAWLEPSGDGEHLYIQLELCGASLNDLISSGHQFTEAELLAIMKQLAGGLRHLHERNMVHLDVKPDNIYLGPEKGTYKLGDFGLVTRKDGSGKVEEGDGRYLPQEMLNGDHSKLDKVDMFSLGATLLELARGEPLPKEGAQYQALRKGKAVLPSRLSPSSTLVRNIKSLLAESPDDRPTAEAICRGSVARGGLGLILQPSSHSRAK